MSEITVKNKEIVVPGQELAKGMDYLPSDGAYRSGDLIMASRLGMVFTEGRFVKVIPLSGKYFPKPGDTVIGKVVDITFGGWIVEIGSAYLANLSIRDVSEYVERGAKLEDYYDFGDIVVAKVNKVTRSKSIDLSTKGPGLKKVSEGKIITVTPSKIPRIIGKSGSMISLLKDKTKCKIIAGQNGRIWINGDNTDNEILVTNAILKIEKESHKEGLTDSINKLLDSKAKTKPAKEVKK